MYDTERDGTRKNASRRPLPGCPAESGSTNLQSLGVSSTITLINRRNKIARNNYLTTEIDWPRRRCSLPIAPARIFPQINSEPIALSILRLIALMLR